MYSEQDFIDLEQEERQLADEAILAMILILGELKGNLEKELRSFYQKYGKDGVVTYAEARKWVSEQDHRRRLTALVLLVSNEFKAVLPNLKSEFEKMLTSVANKETGFFDVEIDKEKVLDTEWGVDEKTWLQRLEADVLLWSVYIANDWKQSILKRQPIDSTLLLLDKRFKSIESIITALGLSESTAIGSLARQKIFKELGINKYQIYTVVDERRCDICGSMHGLIFPMSAYEVGVTASPFHTRCRCWEVPILE